MLCKCGKYNKFSNIEFRPASKLSHKSSETLADIDLRLENEVNYFVIIYEIKFIYKNHYEIQNNK